MKTLLSLLLAILLLLVPAAANCNNEKNFICVFGNPGCNKMSGWGHIKPDIFMISGDWEDFDKFLAQAKKKAGSHPLIIDIEAHGDPAAGLIALQYGSFGNEFLDECSVGYLLKHIDRYFHNKKNLTVTLESCFAGYCYSRTKVMPLYLEEDDLHIDSFYAIPRFPIYGISSPLGPDKASANWNNTVLLSIVTHSQLYIHDLRDDEGKDIKISEDPAAEALLLLYFRILDSMYTP